MKYSSDKDINKYVKKLITSGWSIEKTSKHWRLVSPTGIKYIFSGTPSCSRAAVIFQSHIKRILKEEDQNGRNKTSEVHDKASE